MDQRRRPTLNLNSRRVLDAATGARLRERGVDATTLEHAVPELAELHAADALAGAQLLTAATFLAPEQTLTSLVACARQQGRPVLASLAPHERLDARATLCMEAGADAILLETFTDEVGLLHAVERLAPNMPVLASFSPLGDASLPAAHAMRSAGALAYGLGCGDSLERMVAHMQTLLDEDAELPLFFRPSPAPPGERWTPSAFADHLEPLRPHVWALGACCGGGADHVRALAAL